VDRAPIVCLVTDRRRLSPDARTVREEITALEEAIDEAAGAGVDGIQIRERDLDAADLAALCARVVGRTRGMAVRVLVNDRPDVAVAAGADGVHLRSGGPPAGRVRALAPAGWWIGRSIHAAGDVDLAAPVDYWLFGTMFTSASKAAGAPVQSIAALAGVVRAAAPTPVWVIGGVTPETAPACLAAGAAGLAAIGAFLEPGAGPGAVAARVASMRRAVAADFGKLVQ
jgi:thiamine-phosphate pyrophosphorylase